MGLVSELRRRNVLRMAVLYAVAAWLIMQVAEVLLTLATLPSWIGRVILALLTIGFPIALIFSWFYELTPEGISLEKDVDLTESMTHVTGRRMDFIVISLLCAGLILFAYDKWWTGPPPEKSVAVLAFENLSGDPEQEYFSDGISEELLNTLAQIPELRVISRSSAFAFKDKDAGIPEIAKALNVGHVLEGSVRREGDRVRITAQLIDARSDSHVWSSTFERDLESVFAVQNEIAAAIGKALQVRLALGTGKPKNAPARTSASIEAYDAYLLGSELFSERGVDSVRGAVRNFENAVGLDDNFALAHARLAIAIAMLGRYDELSPGEVNRKATLHLGRAQELEPDLAETHAGRALLAMVFDDDESAIDHARRALELNPSYSDARNWLAIALSALGRYQEEDAELSQLLVIDPLNTIGLYNEVERLFRNGQSAKAHELADRLVEQSAGLGYQAHAITSLWEGRIAEGIFWRLKSNREWGTSGGHLLSYFFILAGLSDEARRFDSALTYWDDFEDGRDEEGIRKIQRLLELNPNDKQSIALAAGALYTNGYVAESLPHFERWLELVPPGRTLDEPGLPVISTIRMAVARKRAGDDIGAQALLQIARQDQAARHAAGRRNPDRDTAAAMVAAIDGNSDQAIALLRSAIERGQRDSMYFNEPVFDELKTDQRHIALLDELAAILAQERDKALQLICFNNPVPDFWQPLPETCEGVVESRP